MEPLLIRIRVNGRQTPVAVAPHHSLCEVLRYQLGLTGTKQGCDKGDCGACTVLVDGEAHLSCLTLAAAVDGADITTIEGLEKPGSLDVVQSAFDRCGALQCGFCQPGMMLSARALLDDNAEPTMPEIREALSGNLCRCTGYTKIFEAVEVAAEMTKSGSDVDTAYSTVRRHNDATQPAPALGLADDNRGVSS